jgi:hypothetical protein
LDPQEPHSADNLRERVLVVATFTVDGDPVRRAVVARILGSHIGLSASNIEVKLQFPLSEIDARWTSDVVFDLSISGIDRDMADVEIKVSRGPVFILEKAPASAPVDARDAPDG